MRYLLAVLSLGFLLVDSSIATKGGASSAGGRKFASNIRRSGLTKQHYHRQQLNQDDSIEKNPLRRRQLDEEQEEWWPAESPTYFELDAGQASQDPNFQLPPRTDTATTTSESATPNSSKSWVVPTIIFTTATIIIVALAICIYQRRDDFDTDAESYNSDPVYEYEQGRRRRPTLNQYAEALTAIGRNNARDVPKHLPEDDDSGEVSGESGSSWGSWMNNRRRRRRRERSITRRGRRPTSTADRGRGSDHAADHDIHRSSSRGGGRPDGGRSRSNGPRGDVEDQSDTSDASEGRSTNKSVTFLKSALKKEKERNPSRSRSLSPSAERSLRKIPRSVSVEPEEYPSITLAPTEANQDAPSGWCFLPSWFGWGDTNADIDTMPLPPPPPLPSSVNHMPPKEPTKKRKAATTYYSSRGSSRDMYSNDNHSASTNGSSQKRRNFDEVGSLAEVRARELMLRLEKEKQKEKNLERQRSSKLTTKGLHERFNDLNLRPNDYSYRRGSSLDARSNLDRPRRDSLRDSRSRPDDYGYRRNSSRDETRPDDYGYRRNSSRDETRPKDYSHRRSSSRNARSNDYPDSRRRDLSNGAPPNDYSSRRDSSQQSTPRRSRSMEPKRTRFDDDDLYRGSFYREENDVEFPPRPRRYDRR